VPVQLVAVNQRNTAATATVISATVVPVTVATATVPVTVAIVVIVATADVAHAVTVPLSFAQRRSTMATLT